jgi:flavin reductase (DIM6/NTAB) family NADH-FMN oxidoreductase RutF
MIIDPKQTSISDFHKILLGTVAPRPIAFASTVDLEGNFNLSPFSFFNCFSVNPPILVFSPARRVRDNTTKHTLENLYDVKEVVINVVNYALVEQASLASTEYDKGINEFVKSGLTPIASSLVKPPRVKESPVAFECKVNDIISLGSENGSGNLILCEILLVHCHDHIFDAAGKVDPNEIDLVARMGADYYCRASGVSLFEVEKPLQKKGIGIDQIPDEIRNSNILTGNNLGRLGNVEKLPEAIEIASVRDNEEVKGILSKGNINIKQEFHMLAKKWIEEGRVQDAWKLLLLQA